MIITFRVHYEIIIRRKIVKLIEPHSFFLQVTKDFFGRITEKKIALPVQEGGRDLIVKSPIWYRYKEGFNNAVRKDLTLQSLL